MVHMQYVEVPLARVVWQYLRLVAYFCGKPVMGDLLVSSRIRCHLGFIQLQVCFSRPNDKFNLQWECSDDIVPSY